jgi:hypothetical protein
MLTKERQSRTYRLSAYFLSKQIAEIPLVLINPTLFTIVVYWVTRLLPDFGRFVAYLLVILLCTLTSQSFGYLFGAGLLNVQKSTCKYESYTLCAFLFKRKIIIHLFFFFKNSCWYGIYAWIYVVKWILREIFTDWLDLVKISCKCKYIYN